MINPAPVVYRKRAADSGLLAKRAREEEDESLRDTFDANEIYEHIKDINDPEHPYSLEQVRHQS